MNIKPLRDLLLIKVGPRPKEIVISDKPEPLNQALVVAVGPDIERSIQPGDAILFAYYAGLEVSESKSERLLIIKQRDVMAKLEAL